MYFFLLLHPAPTETYPLSLHDALPISDEAFRVENASATIMAMLVFVLLVNSIAIVLRNRMAIDRKSTRLNSSHLGISYAVFCLKKKNRYTSYYSNHKMHALEITRSIE